MNRADFIVFVERTLVELILLAEEHTHVALPRKAKFRWLEQDACMEDGIVEAIVNKVWIDPENIYPCVDIGVGDLSEDGSPVIIASVAGYRPRPFQKNWTGREGPFVFILGQPFLEKFAGRNPSPSSSFCFITPEMKNPRP